MDSLSRHLRILVLCNAVATTLSTNSTRNCGGTLLAASDGFKILESPGYPVYENNIDCTLTIETVNSSQVVQAEVLYSSLQGTVSGLCKNDNVTAYDGRSDAYREIWTWCSVETPDILSTGRYLTLRYVTDGSVTRTGSITGFRLRYRQTSARCGKQLFADFNNKSFSSPGYPSSEGNNLNCSWTIRTRYTNIRLVATGYQPSWIDGCEDKVVKVYDGDSKNLLKSFCDYGKTTYISSTALVRVYFVTDSNAQYKSFQMGYTGGHFNGETHRHSSSGMVWKDRLFQNFQLEILERMIVTGSHISSTDHRICGGNLKLTDRFYFKVNYISSPGYPSQYGSKLNCTWIITADRGKPVQLVVADANFEILLCGYDAVLVYDGNTTAAPLMGKLCGTQTPGYVSTGNSIMIRFQTDDDTVKGRFRLAYRRGYVPQYCHRVTLAASRTIKHFTFINYESCTWIIRAAPGSNIRLMCLYYSGNPIIMVHDGANSSSPTVGPLCSQPVLISSNDVMTFQMSSFQVYSVKGIFNVSYQYGHYNQSQHREITSLSSFKYITSVYYPYWYPNDADYTWSINTADSDLFVYYKVTVVDIEYAVDCDKDYLQAFDDRYGYGESLGKWCGTDVRFENVSSGQWMFVKFHSNADIQGTGFKLFYTSKGKNIYDNPSTTGGIIGGIAGFITIILCIFCVVMYRARKSYRGTQEPRECTQVRFESAPQLSQQTVDITEGNHVVTNTVTSTCTFLPPPSYNEVMGKGQEHRAETPPPAYSTVV